jgi:hypothetical protein
MSSFQINPTVAAKDLMRSGNPESMTLEDLKELKKKCEVILFQLMNLGCQKNFTSANERFNIRSRTKEMEVFISRIIELIANFPVASIDETEGSLPEIENATPICLAKIRM